LGASIGYQSFAAIGNGNETYYTIAGQTSNEWEVGIGTYTSSGTTLSRTTVLASSNSGSLVNFSAGTKDVFVTYPAGRSVYDDLELTAAAAQLQATNGIVVNSATVTANYTIPSGSNAMSAGPVTVNSGVTVSVSGGSVWTII
jgi:hypothetical protein